GAAFRGHPRTYSAPATLLGMELGGRRGGPCRPPRGPLSDVHREQVRADMGRALAALGVA
ncbi:dihydrodipicolinate synthase family protein, partial [Amycolatopsis sp. NPDC026612]